MSALFTVAGIAIISELIQKVLDGIGHGDKAVFVKIASYIASGYVAWDVWWDGVHMIASEFGVML